MSNAGGGRLTTHVLDTATGLPASGLEIGLFRISNEGRTHLKTVFTNDDGRCDGPLLEGADFVTGEYELVFAAGGYLARAGRSLCQRQPFLTSFPYALAWPRRATIMYRYWFRRTAIRPTGELAMARSRDPHQIRFILNGEDVALSTVAPEETLLDYLRLRRSLRGTKEGCAEGDCGACTVLVGRLSGGALVYESVNACIRFTGSLNATHVVTVEHLAAKDGTLHPVQQAMVDYHGSQCGFCTPGFVMSLYGLWLSKDNPGRADIEKALQGNLCRCTGYEPIVRPRRNPWLRQGPMPSSTRSSTSPRRHHGQADGDPLDADASSHGERRRHPDRARHGRRSCRCAGGSSAGDHRCRLHRCRALGHEADARPSTR